MNSEQATLFHSNSNHIQDRLASHAVLLHLLHAEKRPRPNDTLAEGWRPSVLTIPTFPVLDGGRVWLLTAGHLLGQVAGLESAGRKLCRVDGHTGLHLNPIPDPGRGTISSLRARWWVDEARGIDFGVVEVFPALLAQMKAHGNRVWRADAMADPEFRSDLFVSVGIPKELRSRPNAIQVGQEVHLSLTDIGVLLPLEAVSSAPSNKIPQFNGRILSRSGSCGSDSVVLTASNGLSGAPIFALQLDREKWGFHPVAVQVSEREEDGTIQGCYLGVMLDCLLRGHSPSQASKPQVREIRWDASAGGVV